MPEKCPICDSDLEKKEDISDTCNYTCPRCGVFQTTDDLEDDLPWLLSKDVTLHTPNKDIQKVAVLSHWIRTKNESMPSFGHPKRILLKKDVVENIVKQPPPKPSEQADKFVLWLGNSKNPPGELIWVQADTHQSIMGAITPPGFGLILEHLVNTEILKTDNPRPTQVMHSGSFSRSRSNMPMQDMHLGANVCLSLKGWDRYEKLKRGATESRKAFMAMKYGEEELDRIVNDFFRDAVKQTGFDLFLLYERPKAGLIDNRLRVEIQTSRFLIADLTHKNPGAYWEAGYAEGLGKPVIYTCEQKKFKKFKTHFDTNHHLTILWDEKNPDEAAKQLKATIRATLPEAAKLTDD